MPYNRELFPFITAKETGSGLLNPTVRLTLRSTADVETFLAGLPAKERHHFHAQGNVVAVDRWHWQKTQKKLEQPFEHFGLAPLAKSEITANLQLTAGVPPAQEAYSRLKRRKPLKERLEQPIGWETPVPYAHSKLPLKPENGKYTLTANTPAAVVSRTYDEWQQWATEQPAPTHASQEQQAKMLQQLRLRKTLNQVGQAAPFASQERDRHQIKIALQQARLLLASPQLIDAITHGKGIRASEKLFRSMAASIDDLLALIDRDPPLDGYTLGKLLYDKAHYGELLSDIDKLWDIHDWATTKTTLKHDPSIRDSKIPQLEQPADFRTRPTSSWVHFKEKALAKTKRLPFLNTFVQPNFDPRIDNIKSDIEEQYSRKRHIATNLPFFGVEFRKPDKVLAASSGAKQFREALGIIRKEQLFHNRKELDELIFSFREKNGAVGRGERIGHAIKRHDKLYKVAAGVTVISLSGLAFFMRILEGAGVIPVGAGGAVVQALKGAGYTLGMVLVVDTILDIGHIIGTVLVGEILKVVDQRILGGAIGKCIHYISKGIDAIENGIKGAAKTVYHSFKDYGFRGTVAKAWSNLKEGLRPARIKEKIVGLLKRSPRHDSADESKEILDKQYGQGKKEHGHHHHHAAESELHHLHHHHRKKTIWEMAAKGIKNAWIGKEAVEAKKQAKEQKKQQLLAEETPQARDLRQFMEHASYLEHSIRKHNYDDQEKRISSHTVMLANWVRRKTYPDHYHEKIIGTPEEAVAAMNTMRDYRAANRKEPVMFHNRDAKIAALEQAIKAITENDLGRAAREAEPLKRFNYAVERVTHLLDDYKKILERNPQFSQLELDALDFLFSKHLRDTKELLAAHDRISTGRHYLSPKTKAFIESFSHTSGTLASDLRKEMEDCILEYRIAEGDITVSRRFGKFTKDILEEFVQPRDIVVAAMIYPILRFTPGLSTVHQAIVSATDKLFDWVGLHDLYEHMGDSPVGRFGRDVIYAHGEQFKDTTMHFLMLAQMLSNDPEAKEHYDLHRRGLMNIGNWAASHIITPVKEMAGMGRK